LSTEIVLLFVSNRFALGQTGSTPCECTKGRDPMGRILEKFLNHYYIDKIIMTNVIKIFHSLAKETIALTVIASLIVFMSGLAMHQALAATTNVDVTMSAGSLSLASSGTATLSGLTVSSSAATSTGSIANVSVTDERGSGAGWSAVMTSQHFTATSSVKLLSGSNSTVTFTGRYDGLDGVLDPNGTFIVEITTGGAVGTAVFKWTDPAGNETTSVTTAVDVTLSNGITAQFATATYVTGDKWSVGVDAFPYTGFQVTPGSITAASGSTTGVTAGSAEFLAGSSATSNSKTLMTAAANNGMGDYDQAPSLSLGVHENSLSGTFKADAVITVS